MVCRSIHDHRNPCNFSGLILKKVIKPAIFKKIMILFLRPFLFTLYFSILSIIPLSHSGDCQALFLGAADSGIVRAMVQPNFTEEATQRPFCHNFRPHCHFLAECSQVSHRSFISFFFSHHITARITTDRDLILVRAGEAAAGLENFSATPLPLPEALAGRIRSGAAPPAFMKRFFSRS